MNPLAFLQNINGPEILLIFLVVLLLFGAKRLPELSKSFGKSIREFKKATSDIEDDFRSAMDEEPKRPKSEAKPAPKQVASESASDYESDSTSKPRSESTPRETADKA